MPFAKTITGGLPLTRDNFRNPPKAMGILPFWFWNGEMDEKEMEWQLKEYHSKGVPGVFIHGRFGLKVPYVSDRWFEKVKFAVAKAKEIGIDTWVYDEMNWPSGTAEQKVLQQYPHLTQKYLELVALQIDGPLFTFLEATDNRYVNTGDSYPIAAFGCSEEEYRNGIKNPIDLTQNLSFERVIPWETPPGKWRLLYFLEKEVPYYIDALNPESTNRFIEITHERYKRAVGGEFGSVVPGFYTDEPAMHYYHVGMDNYVVPWSAQMFKIFRERRGYDLRPWLPALYTGMGEKTAKVRYDFWRTLSEQYTETYYHRIRTWCEENGVLFTGHVLFEEWLRMHARCEGNIFKHLEQMHVIGVDHLYPKIGTPQEPDQHVALKIGSSAAHHFGSTRLLCESMGGSYWDCTLQRMKWIANWEYVLGVNLFNNHGYHYSIEGERKRDWPPSQFYQHTWWKYYDVFTSYMARISHLLSGGRHVAKVLVLYPLSSIWTNYVPQQRNAVGNVIEFDFNYLTDTLLRLHYDYDYVDEDVLAAATVRGGKLAIADEEYSVLILPPVTHVKRSTFDMIRKFVRAGGNVIADTLLPVEFLEASKNGAVRDVSALFGVNPKRVLEDFLGGDVKPSTIHRKAGGKVFVLKGSGLHDGGRRKELHRVLGQCAAPDVTISSDDILYLHRIKDGFDIYFLANTSREHRPGVEITFERIGQPELWNPTTGRTTKLQVFSVKHGRLAITLDFPPSEAYVVVMSAPPDKDFVTDANLTVETFDGQSVTGYATVPGKDLYAKISANGRASRLTAKARRGLAPLRCGKEFSFDTEGDNALLLSRWRMTIDEINGGLDLGYQAPSFDDSAWLRVTNGAWEMQLKQERDQSTYPVTLWYRTTFEVDVLPSSVRLLIDGFSGREHRLFVNGSEVADRGKRSSLDAEIREVDIHPYVRPGTNSIAIRLVATRRTDGILDPLKIIGGFSLDERDGVFRIAGKRPTIMAGDWTEQGYPFYSGTGVYRTEIDVPEHYAGGRLFLEVDCGEDVLEVRVNEGGPLLVTWHPYRVDVTDVIVPGRNRIELKVTNTLINLLEGVRQASGIFSAPRLVHHHRYTLTA